MLSPSEVAAGLQCEEMSDIAPILRILEKTLEVQP